MLSNKILGATMKIAYTFLVSLFIWMNASFVQCQTPNLKFTTKFNDIEIIKSSINSLSIGDTLLFISSEGILDYLNICFGNKCLKFSNIDLGIKQSFHVRLKDAVHVNKNNNILWIALTDGLFVFDGENFVRNTQTLDVPETIAKNSYRHGLYKYSNGDIYISGPNINLIKYDGEKYDTIVSPLSNEEIYIKGKSPQTNLVCIDNKIYFRTIQHDLAYLDIETQEYNYLNLKDSIFKNFLTEEQLLPEAHPVIEDMKKYGDKLFLFVDKLKISSFFYYDGENIEKVELDRDKIFPNDSVYQIDRAFIDNKLRKWCVLFSSGTLYPPYDTKRHHYIIDKDYNYYRIEPEKHGVVHHTQYYGLHDFSNGTTYLNVYRGFLVDDPLGVSVTESVPSFFMNTVRPNPFKDRTQVEITATRAAIDNMKVEIFDYLGKSIRQIEPFITYQPLTGLATLELETDGIRPGYYYLVLTDHNDTRTMPIMIK
jgi:hypothetical protein